MVTRAYIFITFIVLFSPVLLFAQSPHYRHYTVNDGLPSAIVYNMLQDRYGYIWFATENGLARFDGKTFKTFTRKDGLTDNLVLRLHEDKFGRIWITSFTGKLCYYLNGKIYNPDNDSLLSKIPYLGIFATTAPVEEKNGILFIGNRGNFIALKRNKIVYSTKESPKPNRDTLYDFPLFPDNYPVYQHSNYERFFKSGSIHDPYYRKEYYDVGSGIELLLKKASLPTIYAIQYQKKINGDMWFTSSDNGAYQITGTWPDKLIIRQYLSGVVVNDIYSDVENNLWFSTTGNGVYLLAGNSKNASHLTKSAILPQEDINVLFRDKDHTIWAGAINNYLYRIQNHSIALFYSKSKKGTINYCYDIAEDSKGNLFYANNEDLMMFRKNEPGFRGTLIEAHYNHTFKTIYGNYKSLSVSVYNDVIAATPFNLLIYEPGSLRGKRNLMREIPYINNKRILTSFISKTGKIWVANTEGLYRIDGNKWIAYFLKDKVLREPISRISELDDGNLLITTRSKGVVLFDGNKVLQIFSEKNGLASDICNRVFIDGKNIWVATANGVSKLIYQNKQLHIMRNYSTDDGLLSNEINDVVADNDTIYVATAEGLTVLPEIKALKTTPPPVYINTVQYGGFDMSATRDTVLKYAHDYVRFNFIGITYQQPQKIVYKYRLLGSNESWQTNSNGSVDYPALAPGDYTFEVMAKKTDSDWSFPKKFHLVISAPFWMQTWFYFLIYGLLLASLGFAVYFVSRIKRNQNEKKLMLENRMVHLEQQALSALMNPHFIFNALNSIQQYLHQNDTLAANKYLSLFAKLTRQNMEAVVKNSVYLEEELERLELYLNFEKLRFGDKLQYQIIVPPDFETDEILIPPMVLQPFVENSIWHGIMPLKEGGSVFISAKKINDRQYKIEIQDTGIGIDKSRELKNSQGLKHNSKGMQLTIERLELWSRELNTHFELTFNQGNPELGSNPGTLVTLILPL